MAEIHDRYDPVLGAGLVNALERLQAFQIFTSTWFTLSLLLLATSIIVCTLDRTPRLAPVARGPRRPARPVLQSSCPTAQR